MEKEKELCMTPVDLAAGGEELQRLKALVPYLAGASKAFRARSKHGIRNLTAFFSRPAELTAQNARANPSLFEILPEISPYLPSQQREQFSQILPLLEMMQLFSSMKPGGRGFGSCGSLFLPALPGTAGHIFHVLPVGS